MKTKRKVNLYSDCIAIHVRSNLYVCELTDFCAGIETILSYFSCCIILLPLRSKSEASFSVQPAS